MKELFELAEKVVKTAKEKGKTIALAESCTGGMASMAITSIAGSSDVFDRGFVTYSYIAKEEELGVSKNVLEKFGAVSTECVEEMAMGAVRNSHADMAVSISGIAGPGGGMPGKPVGLVYFGYFDKNKKNIRSDKQQYDGNRHDVRVLSAKHALELLLLMLNEN